MDQNTLVGIRIADGRRLIRQLVDDGFPVDVAFWGREFEDPAWFLYIASTQVEPLGPIRAYEWVQKSQRKLVGTTVSLADVKLIKPSDPDAQLMRAFRDRHASPRVLRYQGVGTGGGLDEAYIYPASSGLRVLITGKEEVLRYLEEQAKTETGKPGEYLLAVDNAGELMAVIAGHSFVGSGTLRAGDKKLVVTEGLVTEVQEVR